MIRLSVTDLDSYLYWRDTEEMEFEDLLKRLRGQEPPSEAMMAGRAFHKLFETAECGELRAAIVDGYEFVFDLDGEIALPTIRELKAEQIYDTAAGKVTLVGKVDSLHGAIVHDYKLTERFDAERYADSYQWRAYLAMFHSQRFVYDVFQCRYDGPRVTIYDYHRLPLHAYPSIQDDVQRAVAGLAEIVAEHVPQKIMPEAA